MPRTRRHKHHRTSRSNWAVMGAVVASATFAPRAASAADAVAFTPRLEALRLVVPAETRLAFGPVQTTRGDQRQLRFDILPGLLRAVLAEIERVSGVRIAFTNPAIADIASNGVTGFFT